MGPLSKEPASPRVADGSQALKLSETASAPSLRLRLKLLEKRKDLAGSAGGGGAVLADQASFSRPQPDG